MSDRFDTDRYDYVVTSNKAVSWPEWKKVTLTLIVMCALCVTVLFFDIPNPNMILITGLVIFTSLFGYPSGCVSAVIMLVYSLYFFSTDHSFIRFTSLNLEKMAVIFIGTLLNLVFVGQLKRVENGHTIALRELNDVLKEDNAALEKASMVDALTGLRNRYALRRDYPKYEKKVLHVLMIDVDDFKDINDKYGHNTGDYVLRQVGGMLIDLFGEESCYRYGGDEYLVIKVGMDEKTFCATADRLLERVSKMQLDGESFPVCISGGFVFGAAESPGDLRLMFRHADNKLYEAKRIGKNRIIGTRYKHDIENPSDLNRVW